LCSYLSIASLLEGILGELMCVHGSVQVSGSTAYVSQESWIENGTVRDNICFGAPYDSARFAAVMHACALDTDLKQWSGGELTEIGEKGLFSQRTSRQQNSRPSVHVSV
jgi:hypothetical protein